MSHYWNIPRIWRGDVFIIGGGPSFSSINVDLLKDKHVIGCNDAYRLGSDVVDFVFFRDNSFYNAHKSFFHEYKGVFVTLDHKKRKVRPSQQVKICAMTSFSISPDTYKLSWYRNSGVSAIELAVKLGAERVYLLGYDCDVDKDLQKTNWYESIKAERPFLEKKSRVSEFAREFARFNNDFRAVYPEIEIINLNPKSALDVFPKQEPTEIMK